LASNSLLEALVFSNRLASASVVDGEVKSPVGLPDWDFGDAVSSDEQVVLSHTWDEIRRIMWNYVGIVRTDKRLERADAKISAIRRELSEYYWQYQINDKFLEVRNLAEVAHLTVRAAIQRKESRGIHFNLDHNYSSSVVKDSLLQ
jgi:L-aspartate oxidase